MKCVHTTNADLAHLVERNLAKVEVAGSSPVIRLKRVSEKVLAFFVLSDFMVSDTGYGTGYRIPLVRQKSYR